MGPHAKMHDFKRGINPHQFKTYLEVKSIMKENRTYDELKRQLDAWMEEITGKKPDLCTGNQKQAQAYSNAFWETMHTGMPQNVLKEGSDGADGFLVPDTYENKLVKLLAEKNVLRKIGRTIQTTQRLKFPIVTDGRKAIWIPEGGTYSISEAESGQIVIDAHKLVHMVIVSDEMLEDVGFNLENYIAQISVEAIADAEENAFFNGDGKGKPVGLIHQTDVGAVSAQSGSISMDDMLDLLYSVKVPYRENGTWVISESAYCMLRKIRSHNGRPLWSSNSAEGEPETLLGYPILVSKHLDVVAPGSKSVLFGDFNYFWIGNRGKRVVKRLTERYADHGQVAYVTSERVDAKLVLPEAVKVLETRTA